MRSRSASRPAPSSSRRSAPAAIPTRCASPCASAAKTATWSSTSSARSTASAWSGAAAPDAVTVRRLLTHASGLPRDFPYASWTGPEYPFTTQTQVMQFLAAPAPSSAPGNRYEYSNVGMTRSFSDQHAGARAAGLAAGFSVLQRDGSRLPIPAYEVRGLAAVAGIVSTVEDMARFSRWQIQGALGQESTVLRATSVQEMQSVQFMPADSWTTAGFGFQMWRENDRTFVGHAGTCPGDAGAGARSAVRRSLPAPARQ